MHEPTADQFSEKPLPAPKENASAQGAYSEKPLPTAPAPLRDSEPQNEILADRDSARRALQARIADCQARGMRGANWFFWVAGLSIVNSLVAHGGGDRYFVVGLGVTLVTDNVAKAIAQQNADLHGGVTAFAIGFAVFVAILVSVVGVLSRKGYLVPFGLGMGLYLFDGLIFLLFTDVLSVAFHAYALFCMWTGFSAYRQMRAAEVELRDRELRDIVAEDAE